MISTVSSLNGSILCNAIQFSPLFHHKTRMINCTNLVHQNDVLLYIYSTNHILGHYSQGHMLGWLGVIEGTCFFLRF
jgi:hypothetical protein